MTLLMALLYTETNSQLGADVKGSLPSICGTFGGINENERSLFTASGAFKVNLDSVKAVSGSGSDTDNRSFSFNASYWNSVYRNETTKTKTDTVIPTSIGVTMWKRTI